MERPLDGHGPDVVGLGVDVETTDLLYDSCFEDSHSSVDNGANTDTQLPSWVQHYHAMHDEAPDLFQAMRSQRGNRNNRTTNGVSDDLVRIYLQDIGRHPLLTPEGELHLARRIKLGQEAVRELDLDEEAHHLPEAVRSAYEAIAGKTKADITTFLTSNLRLVVSIAKKYQASGVPLLDLIQEGNLGLEHALEKFEPEKGNKFSTYATWWIRQAIQRGIYDNGRTIRLPVHAGEKAKAIVQTRNRLTMELKREPTEDELADELEMKPEKLREFMVRSQEAISLETPIGESGEHDLKDTIEDRDAVNPEDVAIAQTLGGLLVDLAYEILDERERDILFLRFGITDGEARTPKEVAQLMKLDDVRVRQLEQRAIAKFKHPSATSRWV